MSVLRTHFGVGVKLDHADINASSSGDNTVVAAVTGRRILVVSYTIVCGADATLTWESSGGTVLAGPYSFLANGGVSTQFNEHGHFKTEVGEGLVLNLSSAVQVGGHLLYALI